MKKIARWVVPSVGVWGRCVVLWLAGFTLANLVMGWGGVGPSLNLWWIDLRFLPRGVGDAWLVMFAVLGLVLVFKRGKGWWKRVGVVVCGVTCVVMLANACVVYWLHFSGRVTLWAPVPMSLVLCVLLGGSVWVVSREKEKETARPVVLPGMVAMVVLTVGFAVGQVALFGQTDYRREADAIVVLGARAYADGHPSDMLRDRVMTGIGLYKAGYAGKMVFTGGPGDGAFTEGDVMREIALEEGVPESAIVVDDEGLNTEASARNVGRMGLGRVVLVSHGYHLPRTRMLFGREGLEAVGVPARVRYVPRALGVYVVREAVALVWYWFKG